MTDIRLTAVKRLKAKRYLTILGFLIPNDTETECLLKILKAVRDTRKGKGWPLTSAKIESMAKENHYLNQLVSMKQMFGLNSSIHVVGREPGFGKRMNTVADLIAAGLTPAKYAIIDHNWDRLELIGSRKRDAA